MAAAWPIRERPAEFFELRAQNRQQTSDYVSSGAFALDTIDNDDHAFHGIVFDVELTGSVPIESLTVKGVSVRGALGATKVLTAHGGFAPLPEERDRLEMKKFFSPLKPPDEWCLRYDGVAPPAAAEPRDLLFGESIRMSPRATAKHPALTKLGIYVHSEDAEGVVYNNQRHRGITREDAHLKVLCGVAHTGGAPFARVGYWGDVAWRPRREFVGKVAYDVRLLLWTPRSHSQFPPSFRAMAAEFAKCRVSCMLRPQTEIGLGHLPVEALYYVLAFARHDWAPSVPAPPPQTNWEDEPWEVRRDAYGSRVLVPRSQCADEHDDDDDEDFDEVDDDDDDGEDYDAYYAVNTPSNDSSSDDDDQETAPPAAPSPPRQEVA